MPEISSAAWYAMKSKQEQMLSKRAKRRGDLQAAQKHLEQSREYFRKYQQEVK